MRKLLIALSDAKFESCGLTSLHIEHNLLDESIMPNIGLTLSKDNQSQHIHRRKIRLHDKHKH